jgi:hypothetical protein
MDGEKITTTSIWVTAELRFARGPSTTMATLAEEMIIKNITLNRSLHLN